MNPYVSPFLIYLIELSGSLRFINFIAFFVVLCIVCGYCVYINDEDEYNKDTPKKTKKAIKLGTIFALTFLFIGVILPTADTSYKMLIASYLTPNNISLAGQNAIDYIEKVVEQINMIGVN